MNIESKREREKRIVSEMIGLYCRRNHHTKQGKLCAQCEKLNVYARICGRPEPGVGSIPGTAENLSGKR